MPILIDTGSSGRGFSYFGTAIQCLQKFAYKYRPLGGMPADEVAQLHASAQAEDPQTVALPLRRGSTLHTGLAHLNAQKLGWDVYEPETAMKMVADKNALDVGEFADLRAVFRVYVEKYKYDPWETVDVEKLFMLRLVDKDTGRSCIYTMRVDLIIRVNGKIFFVDHKTSFRVDNSTSTKYQLSGQFIAGDHIGRKYYGADFGGMYLNMLPSGVGAHGNVANQFKRLRMQPTPGMSLDSFKRSVLHINALIEQHDAARTPLLSYPRAMHENICVTQYGLCPYYDRCQWEVDNAP